VEGQARELQGSESGPLYSEEGLRVSSPAAVTNGHAGLVVVLSADAVRIACAERGWSLSELARRARISRPTLAAALRGQPVRARTAWKLARALEQKPSTQLSQLLGAA
jgi:DNA-binding Xre family transcriptional regulator